MKKTGLIMAAIVAILMAAFYMYTMKEKKTGNMSDDTGTKKTTKASDETETDFFEWIKQLTDDDINQPTHGSNKGSYMISRVPHYILTSMAKNGCESIAAVSVLQYAGVDISVNRFIDSYLDKKFIYYKGSKLISYNPEEYYINNPYDSSGWYCYENVIIKAINKFIDVNIYEVKKLTGTTLEAIVEEYIKNDIPVVTWLTINAEPVIYSNIVWTIYGTEMEYVPYVNVHCMVLVGYDENYYYFNDSLNGAYKAYDKDMVNLAYSQVGMRAVAIKKKSNMEK